MSETDPTTPSAPNLLALCATAGLITACISIAATLTVLASFSPQTSVTPSAPATAATTALAVQHPSNRPVFDQAASTRPTKANSLVFWPTFVATGLIGGLGLYTYFPGHGEGWNQVTACAGAMSGLLSAFLWLRAAAAPEDRNSNAAAAGFSGATVLFSLSATSFPLTAPSWAPAWWTCLAAEWSQSWTVFWYTAAFGVAFVITAQIRYPCLLTPAAWRRRRGPLV